MTSDEARLDAGWQVWAVDVSGYSLQRDAEGEERIIDELIASDAERAKIKRYVREIDRVRSLAGKLVLKVAITSLHPDVRWSDIQVATTEHGRPYLTKPDLAFDFNITHDGDWVALGIIRREDGTQGVPQPSHTIGIDVMEIHLPHYEKSVEDFVETMDMTLTQCERAWVMDGAGTSSDASPFDIAEHAIVAPKTERRLDALEIARLQRLYMLWTHKEAFTKACGIGLGFDFAHLEIRFWKGRGSQQDDVMHIDENSKAGNVIAADIPSQYTFAAIVLPPGQLGTAFERRSDSVKRAGAGSGGPSLLVLALPRAIDNGQLPRLQSQRASRCLTSNEAQSLGRLCLSTMNELVNLSLERSCKWSGALSERS